MPLGSVLQTAHTGLSAAEASIGAAANNLANVNTPGFKQSRATSAAQPSQTIGRGAAPTARNGGRNPTQIGLGVQAAETATDFSQGQITLDARPTQLAISGDGLFILENAGGERRFTRNGNFHVGPGQELTAAGGERVLGFTADAAGQLQTGGLTPLRIPLGRQFTGASGATATLDRFHIERDGRVVGRLSDGSSRLVGQVRLARFNNPGGLAQRAGTQFEPGPNAGLAVEVDPGVGGAGEILSGATEQSNTDIGRNLVDLTLASFQFRASLATASTADSLLDGLLNLPRSR